MCSSCGVFVRWFFIVSFFVGRDVTPLQHSSMASVGAAQSAAVPSANDLDADEPIPAQTNGISVS